MIKLVIFDLDGVLIDMKDIHFHSLNEAIKEFDKKYVISYSDHITIYDGMKTKDKLNMLSQKLGLPTDSHEKIWTSKQQKTVDFLKTLQSNEIILDTLKSLKKLNLTTAVASNSIRETVKKALYYTGYIEYIDFFYSNDDVHLAKPNTEIYLRCMISANVSPKETLIIEDSPIGIRGAENTGSHVIRVKNSSNINSSIIHKVSTMNKINNLKPKWKNNSLNIVIPMAGNGSRFEQAGYTFPKPLIEVFGDPMIKKVVDSLNIDAKYIFIVQKSHLDQYNLKSFLNLIAPNCKIITVDEVTQGAACTVLLAKEFINNDDPLIIANSDQYIVWDSCEFMYSMENSTFDGAILTFESTHPKWSFVKTENNIVTEVAEKKPISNVATVGVYYWSNGSNFVKYAEQMIANNIRVNNEFYVCPVFNEAIKDNKKFKTYNVNEMWGLGTPEDLSIFLQNYKKDK